jgi:hypothetical protein
MACKRRQINPAKDKKTRVGRGRMHSRFGEMYISWRTVALAELYSTSAE